MAALEPVIVTLLANTSEFTAGLDVAKAKMGEFAAESEVEGDAAGSKFSGGVSGGLSKLGSLLSGTPLAPLAEGFNKAGDSASELDGKSKGLFSTLSSIGGVATVGLAAGFGAVAAEGVHLAMSMQSADAAIAVASGTSVKSATAIGNAFLNTAGQSEFSGQELATAFAAVAGQLKSTQGSALNAAQAMQVMNAASDLATAKQISLGSATSTVAETMQTFQMKTADAAKISDILLNASNATGVGITSLGSQLDRVRAKLGDLSPPLGQLSGLLVDLKNHGETGRASMTALNTSFTAFLKPAVDAAKATSDLKVATEALPGSLRALAEQYETGTMTTKQVTSATKDLDTSQTALWGKFKSAADAALTADDAQKKLGVSAVTASGQLAPMSSIIGQLSDKIKGMNPIQAASTLAAMGLANASKQMIETIQAGPAAFDAATTAVTKAGAAHAAAAQQAQTLSVEFKTIKATADDVLIQFGQLLIPVIQRLGQVFVSTTKFVLDHKEVLYTLGVLVGGFLATTIAAFTINTIGSMIASIERAGSSVIGLVSKLLGLDAGLTTEAGAAAEAAAANERLAVTSTEAGAASGEAGLAGGLRAGAIGATTLTGVLGPMAIAAGVATLGAVALGNAIAGSTPKFIAQSNAASAMADETLPAMTLKLDELRQAQDKASQSLDAGGIIGKAAKAAYQQLGQQIDQVKVQHQQLTANVDILAGHFGISKNQAEQVAQVLGVDLRKALDPAQVTAFGQQMNQMGIESDGAKNKLTDMSTNAVASLSDMASKLKSAADQQDWAALGNSIATGVANGINQDAGAAINAAVNMATAALNAAKSSIKAHSPSQRAADEIGAPFAQGVAAGILNNTHLAISASESLTQGLLGGTAGSLGINIGGGIAPIPSGGSGGGNVSAQIVNQPINLVVNGQTLASIVTQFQLRSGRSTGNILGGFAGTNQSGTATGLNTNAVAR